MAVTLTQWLGSRTPAQVAAILTTRPDSVTPPVPRHLGELAERLEIVSSVAEAVHRLPAPAVQVVEVLQLLGPDAGDRNALGAWFGCAPEDPELTATLELLTAQALVWPDGERWQMAEPLYAAFRHPLGLGPPAGAMLSRHPVEQLRPIARALGVPPHGRKQELVGRIAGELADPERVRALVATADRGTRARLDRLAVQGPPTDAVWYGYYRPDPGLNWATQRGLVLADSWGVPQLVREVAVALRGPGWHAPFTPRRPGPELAPVDPAAVEREAAAAGGAAVDQITALLEAIGAAPVSLLKAGGVGVKEQRRLARTLGTDQDRARLWLELAFEAELLGAVRHDGTAQLLPTPAYDRWAAAEPADRLAALLPVWVDLPAGPLSGAGAREAGAKAPPALVRDHDGLIASTVRQLLVLLAFDLPAGHGAAGPAPRTAPRPPADPLTGGAAGAAPPGLADALCWQSPLVIARHDAERLVAAAWREAELVGVVAHGTLTSLGRSLVDRAGAGPPGRRLREPQREAGGRIPPAPPAELAQACRSLLPGAVREAIFQADLTAMVPGTPAQDLAALLDAAADRESRGGAVTWRFGAASVRRALDAGHDPDGLLAELKSRAAAGTLPQPLRYLIADVARRHGAVQVRQVACVLRAEDPALVAEIAGARALRSLTLSVVAPTVLGSAAPVPETLAALRAAGYAPVEESLDGVPKLERVQPRRAEAGRRTARPGSPRSAPPAAVAGPAGPRELATALLAAPVPSPAAPAQRRTAEVRELERRLAAPGFTPPEDEPDLAEQLEALAGHLAAGERHLLAQAIETSHPVTIGYTNAQGNHTTRVIDEVELDGGHLVAWCQLRDDERVFTVGRIDSVAPAA